MPGKRVPGTSVRSMKNDGFTTVDALVAIALTGLLIAGLGPLFRVYSSDLPQALERNREGIAFHHLSRDVKRCLEEIGIGFMFARSFLRSSSESFRILRHISRRLPFLPKSFTTFFF